MLSPGELGQLRVALQQLERRVLNGLPNVVLPEAGTADVGASAERRADGTALDLVDPHLLDARVIDDGHRIAFFALVEAVDARGKHEALLRGPGGLADLRLTRKCDFESVFDADVVRELLRRREPRHRKNECEHRCRRPHGFLRKHKLPTTNIQLPRAILEVGSWQLGVTRLTSSNSSALSASASARASSSARRR